jgi:chemotaxis signal transduction protein
MRGTPVGIVVDRVLEVTQIDKAYISNPPVYENEKEDKFISGIAKFADKPVILLDCEKLLSHSSSEFSATPE